MSKIKQIEFKKFEEFKEDQQEEILDKYRDILLNDFDFFAEFYLSEAVREINKKGLDIKEEDIFYSFGGRELFIYIESKHLVNYLLNKYEGLICDIDIPQKLGLYANYLGGGLLSGLNRSEFNPEYIIFEENINYKLKEKLKSKIFNIVKEIQDILKETLNNLINKYDYLCSDEALKDYFISNDIYFNSETLEME